MVRNWLFTLFYCISELWGDVVLSLLFWGLANETTSIEDAPLLYPLFGIGANIAQTMAGALRGACRVWRDGAGCGPEPEGPTSLPPSLPPCSNCRGGAEDGG